MYKWIIPTPYTENIHDLAERKKKDMKINGGDSQSWGLFWLCDKNGMVHRAVCQLCWGGEGGIS